MKRITVVLTVVLTMISTVPAFAASGSVAGQYYSTNIHTLLNGAEIDSINIGGQTLISAEDMVYYLFSVYWVEEARQLPV